jgi:hypothetical protein
LGTIDPRANSGWDLRRWLEAGFFDSQPYVVSLIHLRIFPGAIALRFTWDVIKPEDLFVVLKTCNDFPT